MVVLEISKKLQDQQDDYFQCSNVKPARKSRVRSSSPRKRKPKHLFWMPTPLKRELSMISAKYCSWDKHTKKHDIALGVVSILLHLGEAVDTEELLGKMEFLQEKFPRYRARIEWNENDDPLGWVPCDTDLATFLKVHRRSRTLAELEAECNAREFKRFPRDRSPWEVHCFTRRPSERMNAVVGKDTGGTSLLIRLHHSLGDGAAFLAVLSALTDQEIKVPERRIPGKTSCWLDLATRIGLIPLVMKWLVCGFCCKDQTTALRGTRLEFDKAPRQMCNGFVVPLNDIREIKRAVKGTVNDVMVTILARAQRKYLLRTGLKASDIPDSTAIVPVNFRGFGHGVEQGVDVGMMPVALYSSIEDPALCLSHTVVQLEEKKNSLLLPFLKLAAYWSWINPVDTFPFNLFYNKDFLTFKCERDKAATCAFTNVPGPLEQISLMGAPLLDMSFYIPPDFNLLYCGLSYNGNCRITLGSRDGVDNDLLRDCLSKSHNELKELVKTKPKALKVLAEEIRANSRMKVYLGYAILVSIMWVQYVMLFLIFK